MRVHVFLWFFLAVATANALRADPPEEQYRKAMSLLVAHNNNPVDVSDALYLLRLSADGGFAPAQTALGTAYERGFGVAPDVHWAIDWYTKAAKQGDWVAQFSLGRLYLQGNLLQRDFTEARKWLEMAAADPRDSGASFLLGTLYYDCLLYTSPSPRD